MAKVTITIEDVPETIPGRTNIRFLVHADPLPPPEADPVKDYTLAQFIGAHAQEYIKHVLVSGFDGKTQDLKKG